MFYFDNEYLKQYLDQEIELKVFVNGDMLNITSKDDIKDPVYGIATDSSGKTHTFNYKDIERIKAGSHDLGIDQLQSNQDTDSPNEPDDSTNDDSEDSNSEPDLDLPAGTPGAEDKPDKEPKESVQASRTIVEITNKKSKYNGLKGTIISKTNDYTQYRALNSSVGWRWGDIITIWENN